MMRALEPKPSPDVSRLAAHPLSEAAVDEVTTKSIRKGLRVVVPHSFSALALCHTFESRAPQRLMYPRGDAGR